VTHETPVSFRSLRRVQGASAPSAETGWAEVVGLDRRGRVKARSPYRLAIEWHKGEVDSQAVSPDGLLYVATRTCGGPVLRATLVALDPDGNVSE